MSATAELNSTAKESEAKAQSNAAFKPTQELAVELDGAFLSRALSGAPGEPPADGAVRVLRSPTLSHPANSRVRAVSLKRTQQTFGNRFAQRAVAPVQKKPATTARVLQRHCSCAGACSACQGKTVEEEEPKLLQRQTPSAGTPGDPPNASVVPSSSSGQPLEKDTRSFMERRFGSDFSNVRIHTGTSAAQSADALQADAYATGRDIYFAARKYAPETASGRHLLAHELTHTIQQQGIATSPTPAAQVRISQPTDPLEIEADQVASLVTNGSSRASKASGLLQRTGESFVAREPQGHKPAAPPSAPVKAAVDVIVDALEGYTSRWDSENIVAQFKNNLSSAGAILAELKARAAQLDQTAEGMIDWLLGDLTEEDRRELRGLLIKAAVPDMRRLAAHEILELLSGYTSEADSSEIFGLLNQFDGSNLDALLGQLEAGAKLGTGPMALFLFGDMDRVNAERLRQQFFKQGTQKALVYAAFWTASKINSLLEGYASHADSSQVLWNFQSTPAPYQVIVKASLDPLTRASLGKGAGEALMENLDKSDYDTLSKEPDLKLPVWKDTRGLLRKAMGVAEWIAVYEEWIVCGVVGIVTGILSAIWEILVGVWDIGVAVWNLIWSLIYLISGGAAGSENWLAVKEFFGGLKALGSPGKLWDQYWEELKLEFKTIEGPLTQCRVAELAVRKFINAIVNIVLIFVAGYGLVKIGVKAVQSITELAALAREIGVLQALLKTGAKVGGSARKLISVTAPAEIAKLANMVRNPVEILVRAGSKINLVLLAVREEGVWAFMRNQTGVLIESEKKFWREQKESWRGRAENQQTRHSELSDDAVSYEKNLEEQKAPENPEEVANKLQEDSKKLENDVDDLHNNLKDPEGPATVTPGVLLPRQPDIIDLLAEQALGGHSLERHSSTLRLAELRERVLGTHSTMPQSRTAMKFTNPSTHAESVNQAYLKFQTEIEQHFASGGGYQEWTFENYGSQTGVGFTNTGTRANPVVEAVVSEKVTISLDRHSGAPRGFYLVSAFPAWP